MRIKQLYFWAALLSVCQVIVLLLGEVDFWHVFIAIQVGLLTILEIFLLHGLDVIASSVKEHLELHIEESRNNDA